MLDIPTAAPTALAGSSLTRPPVRASVIVLNYNGRRYLEACLGSLLAAARAHAVSASQDEPADEIILFDNASSDGSADYVEERFPEVQVIRNTENTGFAGGNNAAAGYAAGEYVVFLNPDTTVRPGWLDALIGAFDADPRVGVATSQLLMLSQPDRINTCGNDIHCSGLTLCRGLGQAPVAPADPVEVAAASGAALAIRRELFEQLGGFDHDFFMYMEDTDLSWRARLAGYRVVFVPASVVYHDYKLRFGPNKTFYQERNRYLMLLKIYRWPTLIALLPALLLAEVVSWGFVLTRDRGRLGNKVRAYAWIAANWAMIMERRRGAQALRRATDRDLLAISTHALSFEQVDSGLVGRLSHAVFDPLFLVFHRFALAVVRW